MKINTKMKFQIVYDLLVVVLIFILINNIINDKRSVFTEFAIPLVAIFGALVFKPKNKDYFIGIPKKLKVLNTVAIVTVVVTALLVINLIFNKQGDSYIRVVYSLLIIDFILLLPVKLHYYKNYRENEIGG